jgi:hypothetical protein
VPSLARLHGYKCPHVKVGVLPLGMRAHPPSLRDRRRCAAGGGFPCTYTTNRDELDDMNTGMQVGLVSLLTVTACSTDECGGGWMEADSAGKRHSTVHSQYSCRGRFLEAIYMKHHKHKDHSPHRTYKHRILDYKKMR